MHLRTGKVFMGASLVSVTAAKLAIFIGCLLLAGINDIGEA
jgi:hypothetical protein